MDADGDSLEEKTAPMHGPMRKPSENAIPTNALIKMMKIS
jgi:hypothetical protein